MRPLGLIRRSMICAKPHFSPQLNTHANLRHSTDNVTELERLHAEHPGEQDIVTARRVLGSLPMTRGVFSGCTRLSID